MNENSAAIKLLEQYPNNINIDWEYLSDNENPAAIKLLKQHQDKIDWVNLSKNPAIFKSYRYTK
jgi:hypothetical protein